MKSWGRILFGGLPLLFVFGCPDLIPGDECTEDADCAAGEVCTNGNCVAEAECDTDDDCAAGEDCVNGECVADGGNGGDPVAGEAFYNANNCAACHAADGSGGLGPDIRVVSSAEIFANLSGTDPHTGGTVAGVTQDDADDLEAWLATQ